MGLGIILNQGIGDTIRVSPDRRPVEEVKSAKLILKTLGAADGGIEVVSCPTCGRTRIDLICLANQVETMAAEFDSLNIKLAVMGRGERPGGAKEADLGIAGGVGEGADPQGRDHPQGPGGGAARRASGRSLRLLADAAGAQ